MLIPLVIGGRGVRLLDVGRLEVERLDVGRLDVGRLDVGLLGVRFFASFGDFLAPFVSTGVAIREQRFWFCYVSAILGFRCKRT